MSDRPSAPSLPDVFSTPSPSLPLPTSPQASLPPAARHLVPVARGWVNATATSIGDALLEPISEDYDGEENDVTSASEARDALINSAPRPATPPPSPHGPQLGGTLSASDSGHEQVQYTSSRLARRDRAIDSPLSPLSPRAPIFNPVVGSASTTPARRERPFKSLFSFDPQVKSASNPATPQRFSAFQPSSFPPDRGDPAPAPQSWTWPPRVVKPGEALKRHYTSPLAPSQHSTPTRFDEDTPTKTGRVAPSLVDSPFKQVFAPAPVKLATRYALVEGLRQDLTESDLRELLLPRCAGLSVRGCFTARLREYGEVVLLFHDVRHALAAARLVQFDESGEQALSAKCISRQDFEQAPLLSQSEAVLVFTLRGPTPTPSFTPLSLLAAFGEIRSLKVVEEHLHVVEYWDDRSAEQAYKVLKGRETGGARFDCSFEPVVASTDLPAWTQSSTTPSTSAAAPAASLFPPTPAATPLAPSPPLAEYFSPLAQPFAFEPGGLPTPRGAFAGHLPPLAFTADTEQRRFDPPASNARPFPPPDIQFGSQQYQSHPAPPHAPIAPAGLTPFPPAPPSTFPFAPTPAPTAAAFESLSAAAAPSWSAKRRSRVGQDYGIVRDDRIPAGNVLNFERIERGLDVRTTVMIKNIPNKLKDVEVMDFIEEVVGRAFDFFYLRCDYSNDCNVGYGFCNFTSTAALLAFAKARLGTRWNRCGSDKLVVISYANIQGKASLVSHFRNSSVLDQAEARRPKLFVTSGPRAGEPEPFPLCDDPIRKARSAMNASTVGLFPSQRPVFKVAQAFKGLSL
ncbi:hypothetical protein JCM10449v2_006072 [Rhodotorula kratochvilovae]